jgi:hypothetical protein
MVAHEAGQYVGLVERPRVDVAEFLDAWDLQVEIASGKKCPKPD